MESFFGKLFIVKIGLTFGHDILLPPIPILGDKIFVVLVHSHKQIENTLEVLNSI
jgi:hypothetical protein